MLPRGTSFAIFSAFALLSLAMTGCAARPKLIEPKPQPQAGGEIGSRPAEVQQALMVFVDRFMPAMAEACDYIESNATTPQARATAKARKVGAALAAMKNAANPNPYAGLLDTVVMVTLLSDVADSPDFKAIYGVYGQRLSTVLAAQREQAWAMAARFVTDSQLEELRRSIDEWRKAHPTVQYVSFVRMSEFPETRQIQKDDKSRRPNSVFGLLFLDPLSNLDPAVREFEMSRQLAERAFFYLQRMPLLLAWQTDQMYTEMLTAPEVQRSVSSAETFAMSTTRFVQSTSDVASVTKQFHRDIPQWRRDAVADIEQALDRQRTAAIRQATTTIAAERDAAVRQVAAALRGEQHEIAGSLDRVLQRAIDQAFWRGLGLVCVLLIGVLICIMAIRRIPGRAPPEDQLRPETEARARSELLPKMPT
jgi:hypothetical protein